MGSGATLRLEVVAFQLGRCAQAVSDGETIRNAGTYPYQ